MGIRQNEKTGHAENLDEFKRQVTLVPGNRSELGSRKRESTRGVDPLSRYLSEIGIRRMKRLAERTEIAMSRMKEWRDNPQAPIKYLQALRIVRESAGHLKIEDILKREVSDREKYDNPLGRKIACVLISGVTLTSLLERAGISHNEFNRWLMENTKWTETTKAKLRAAFEPEGVALTDEDFEDHYVDRLRCKYEKARDEVLRRRHAGGLT